MYVDPTGLVYYGRRYYTPAFGRWLTPDPAGFTDGMNLYAFVHNDPLTHFDEYGLLDIGQWDNPALYRANQRLFESGVRSGTIDAAFDVARLASTIGTFGLGKQPLHSWLNEKQSALNEYLFASIDKDSSSFQTGRFWGGFAVDGAVGSLALKGATRGLSLVKDLGSLGVGNPLRYVPRFSSKTSKGMPLERGLTPKKYFLSHSYREMEMLLIQKFGPPKGAGPYNKSFFNSRTKRTFNLHKDPMHHAGKAHVDIRKRGLSPNYHQPFFLQE